MASEFESGFFTKTAAWHGRGNVLQEAPKTAADAIAASGTNWQVVERPVFVDIDQDVACTPRKPSDRLVFSTTHKAIVRSDTNAVLGIVGNSYTPVQNTDAFEWFNFLLEDGSATLDAGGSLRGGQKIWVLARMNGEADVVKNDPVASYLLLCNSHDGSMGLVLQFTPIRVVCMNTLNASLDSLKKDVRHKRAIVIRHTASIQEQLTFAQGLVNTTNHIFDSSVEAYRSFAKAKMSDAEFEEYFINCYYGTNKPEFLKGEDADIRKSKIWGNVVELFSAGKGQDNSKVRGTVWAGYNAITEFVDYYRGSEGNRLNSAWFGGGADLRERAFAEAQKICKAA